MIKMIVCDMDGTLLNSNKIISDENFKAIKYAMEKDVLVMLATGRIYTSAKLFAKKLNLHPSIIACNGALIQDYLTQEKYYEKPIKKNLYKRLFELLKENNLYYYFYTDKHFYTSELKYSALYYMNNNENLKEDERIDIKLIDDIERIIEANLNILKFIIIDDDIKKLKTIKQKLSEIDNIEISQSWVNNIEIMSKSVSKGNALKLISKRLEIMPENIMAIGDHMNDISMIKTVGYGIAMKNGEKELKDLAFDITDSNDDNGVASAIYKYI
ncbi:Cof subfamily protein (haloacid dehalogenase superfamily) [Acetoanaerobium pronyense]|uniref:Cof subfamily protein (Haloacid dehalogenase superfamily) n=1 Tax=Acetoanaerobium pronyense TaxID=1482736 RepID=A0ABS4KIB6_9FIRM|nr:Cof-type HAD-IIB family hydrolase [Acetoanaerobium pronyense]MBP2026991.1 Cof subfamily protein (haloacid dehalogenase superfamily) [Acetoanaerobium pronyense]